GLLLAAQPACAQSAPPSDAALADYQARLAQYQAAHDAYDEEANRYWTSVSEKRKLRNAKRRSHEVMALADYVLTQPPVYSGPPRPVSPLPPPPPVPPRPEIPVAADFLQAAREHWNFVPDQASDAEFKRAYAEAAHAAGLTRDQVVGVYAFETGGKGSYDTQAGLEPPRPGAHAISPAIGYNQLLSTNTVSLFAENGQRFLAALERKAKTLSGGERQRLENKITVLRGMIVYCRSLPHNWSGYDEIAKNTPKGWGIHAAIFDIDVGPLLQVQKLLDSVLFARAKGYMAPLSAAELELMNLTGDGNGIDMVMMSQAFRDKVPTANFFQPQGYARNPVARRTVVVAGLIAEIQDHMNRNAQTPGARELAAAF
ncbi:MAG TPA: hypothetical protein VGF02_05370, partial [Pseudolabrys sp.]